MASCNEPSAAGTREAHSGSLRRRSSTAVTRTGWHLRRACEQRAADAKERDAREVGDERHKPLEVSVAKECDPTSAC